MKIDIDGDFFYYLEDIRYKIILFDDAYKNGLSFITLGGAFDFILEFED